MIGGHGHVTPRQDGARARCGGPAICSVCAAEKAQLDASRLRMADMVAPTLEDKAELDAHMMEVESFAIAFAFYEGRQNGGTKYLVDGMRKAVRASALKLMGLSDE